MSSVPFEDSEQLQAFVRQVQERAGLGSYNETHQLARATVRALGASVSAGQAEQLAQWLPDKLRAELGTKDGQAARFDKASFVDTVGGEIHTVDTGRVETQAAAVLQSIRAAAPSEQINDTLAQLPPELAAMFDSPSGSG
ncbi:MAG: DUF2267 domain-containing protein [Streptosporangiales bacterium]